MLSLIPSFYVNITEKCNMKCEYCPTYSENWESTEGLLDVPTLLRTLHAAHSLGIESYRISGGEPMIFPDRVFAVIQELNSLNVHDIILNTNGFNLYKHIDSLKRFSLRKVKVSLDTLDRAKFKDITNTDKLNDVLSSIQTLKANSIPQEINMVVIRKNAQDFWPLLDYCVQNELSLKLLDLVFYDILVRNDLTPEEYFRKAYVNLNEFVPELESRFGKPRVVRLSNERGIPMLEFKIGKTATLTLKDGTRGSTFADVCHACKIFPCQEGLFHLSLSAEGNLTPCRLRRDLTVSIAKLTNNEMVNVFRQAILAYQDPFFVEHTTEFPTSQLQE